MAGTALSGTLAAGLYAGENNTIKVALVGCGGRGNGAAANALATAEPEPNAYQVEHDLLFDAPVMPDAQGKYPVPMPGLVKAF